MLYPCLGGGRGPRTRGQLAQPSCLLSSLYTCWCPERICKLASGHGWVMRLAASLNERQEFGFLVRFKISERTKFRSFHAGTLKTLGPHRRSLISTWQWLKEAAFTDKNLLGSRFEKGINRQWYPEMKKIAIQVDLVLKIASWKIVPESISSLSPDCQILNSAQRNRMARSKVPLLPLPHKTSPRCDESCCSNALSAFPLVIITNLRLIEINWQTLLYLSPMGSF